MPILQTCVQNFSFRAVNVHTSPNMLHCMHVNVDADLTHQYMCENTCSSNTLTHMSIFLINLLDWWIREHTERVIQITKRVMRLNCVTHQFCIILLSLSVHTQTWVNKTQTWVNKLRKSFVTHLGILKTARATISEYIYLFWMSDNELHTESVWKCPLVGYFYTLLKVNLLKTSKMSKSTQK